MLLSLNISMLDKIPLPVEGNYMIWPRDDLERLREAGSNFACAGNFE